jgi:hypothetical protein
MNSNNWQSETQQTISVNWGDRWQVYHRLQALEIPCQCATNKPLKIQLDSTKTAIQLWSVTRQFTASRDELVQWLECCWQMKSYRK